MTVSTWEILKDLGFSDRPNPLSEGGVGLVLRMGAIEVAANLYANEYLQPVVHLSGVIATLRSLARIEYDLPRTMESKDQVKAWVAYALQNSLEGLPGTVDRPEWFDEGLHLQSLLPWVRGQARYLAQPRCYVERDWARVALKRLASHLESSASAAPMTFGFDGEVLKIVARELRIAVPAAGTPWPDLVSINPSKLRPLPRRLMRNLIEFYVRETDLIIGNCLYRDAVEANDAHG